MNECSNFCESPIHDSCWFFQKEIMIQWIDSISMMCNYYSEYIGTSDSTLSWHLGQNIPFFVKIPIVNWIDSPLNVNIRFVIHQKLGFWIDSWFIESWIVPALAGAKVIGTRGWNGCKSSGPDVEFDVGRRIIILTFYNHHIRRRCRRHQELGANKMAVGPHRPAATRAIEINETRTKNIQEDKFWTKSFSLSNWYCMIPWPALHWFASGKKWVISAMHEIA